MVEFRLKAIREYTTMYSCNHSPPNKTLHYIITFADEDGIVVTDCNFCTKEEADFVVDAVNKRYNELGEPEEHVSEWLEEDDLQIRAKSGAVPASGSGRPAQR